MGDGAQTTRGPREEPERQRGPDAARGQTRALPERTSVPLPEPTSPLVDAGLAPGARIGSYELIRELGRGGMGVVFVARDVKLGRRVAIKFVLESEPEFLQRFMVEARATARCQHENIVVIHDVGEHNGLPFMVLEYLKGDSLDRFLESSPMAPGRAVEIVVPIARALVHAHGHGIVHRDLKPENVFVTDSGTVKVLDFGIATALARSESSHPARRARRMTQELPVHVTEAGLTVGTPLYMAPEQLSGNAVDGRADVWALGVVLHLLVTGLHPLGNNITRAMVAEAATSSAPLPSSSSRLPSLDRRVAALVDRCLQKRVEDRYQSAEELLADLERLLPGRHRPDASTDECPFPGLAPFSESDAGRYFGRDADVVRMLSRLDRQPLMAVVGPSGAGKSSFVRAGVVPALRDRGGSWEVATLRPGTDPIGALVALAARLDTRTLPVRVDETAREIDVAERLVREPGTLGAILRGRASLQSGKLLLFVDQFEELYTLVHDVHVREAFVAALLGAADDPESPVRVVLSMRSDFVDRAAEHAEFIAELTRGLLFLGPMARSGLREALERPAALAGAHFESASLVEQMLDELVGASSPLPLLQFAAAKLWEGRERRTNTLSAAVYLDMGGLGGALATHADHVLAEMTPEQRERVRGMFCRLVTTEHTRALLHKSELLALSDDAEGQQELIDRLVAARLVAIHTGAGEATVEIIHESLVASWPTLRGWLESDRDDAAFLRQLSTTAKLWHDKGRSDGLLWRGDALAEARRWRKRAPDHRLPPIEQAYLEAVFSAADRAQRMRRRLWAAAFAALATIAAVATVALFLIRDAETTAQSEARRARDEAARAKAALQKAKRAELHALDASRQAARASAAAHRESEKAERASEQVRVGKESLREANQRLAVEARRAERERDRARAAQKQAEAEAKRARAAESDVRAKQVELSALLREKEQRLRKLEAKSRQISTDL